MGSRRSHRAHGDEAPAWRRIGTTTESCPTWRVCRSPGGLHVCPVLQGWAKPWAYRQRRFSSIHVDTTIFGVTPQCRAAPISYDPVWASGIAERRVIDGKSPQARNSHSSGYEESAGTARYTQGSTGITEQFTREYPAGAWAR